MLFATSMKIYVYSIMYAYIYDITYKKGAYIFNYYVFHWPRNPVFR